MARVAVALWRDVLPTSPVFTTRRAAAAAGVGAAQASRDLSLLERDGLVRRLARGVWADTRHPRFSPYAAVPALLPAGARGYVSLLSALSLHGMIQQVPRVVHVVTSSRAPRTRRTTVATYRFHLMDEALVDGFRTHPSGTFALATPAKALFDTLYFSVRKGRRYAFLPELSLPAGLRRRGVEGWIARVRSAALRTAVARRWRLLLQVSGARRPRRPARQAPTGSPPPRRDG